MLKSKNKFEGPTCFFLHQAENFSNHPRMSVLSFQKRSCEGLDSSLMFLFVFLRAEMTISFRINMCPLLNQDIDESFNERPTVTTLQFFSHPTQTKLHLAFAAF